MVVNTLILLIVGLPVLDVLVVRSGWLRASPDPRKQYYLYGVAKKDPVAFGRWWNYYETQWRQVEERIYAGTQTPLGFRLRRNSRAVMVRSPININSHGFRGREISKDKGNAYRIVVLGESTTFGITFNAEDRPWPEELEQLIRSGSNRAGQSRSSTPACPGIGWTRTCTVSRRRFCRLQPDMVISYHGVNGFGMLRKAVPFPSGRRLPLPTSSARSRYSRTLSTASSCCVSNTIGCPGCSLAHGR